MTMIITKFAELIWGESFERYWLEWKSQKWDETRLTERHIQQDTLVIKDETVTLILYLSHIWPSG